MSMSIVFRGFHIGTCHIFILARHTFNMTLCIKHRDLSLYTLQVEDLKRRLSVLVGSNAKRNAGFQSTRADLEELQEKLDELNHTAEKQTEDLHLARRWAFCVEWYTSTLTATVYAKYREVRKTGIYFEKPPWQKLPELTKFEKLRKACTESLKSFINCYALSMTICLTSMSTVTA